MPYPRRHTAAPALVLAGLAVFIIIAAAGRLFAQVPGVTPPPLPLGSPAQQAPGGRPFAAGVPDLVRLQFANTDVTDVLDNYYGPLTGKRVIYDNTLQGKLTVYINTPVPREEAIRILENNLMLNFFAIVQGEGNFVKVINSTTKNPRFYGPPILSDPAQIPDGDQVISFLIKPRYLDIQELQAVLSQYIQIQKQYTNFLALPKAGAILATEESTTIRRLLGMVEALDLPPATVIDRFIKLERADAAKAVEFVNAVLGREKAGQGTATATGVPGGPANPNARRPIRRVNEEGQPVPDNPLPFGGVQPSQGLNNAIAALSEGALTAGSVNILADVRTNRVHVVARPIDFPFIERLIVEFDANTPFASPVRRALRFVSATDMLPILVQTLTEQGAPDSGGQGANAANPNATRNANNRGNNSNNSLGSFGSSSSSNGSSSGSLFGSSGGDSTGSSTGGLGTSNLQTREVSDTPQAAVVGTTRLLADPRTNSISILGGAEARDKVSRVLDLLDVPTPQVMIEVLIGELQLTDNQEFGINYLLRTNKNFQVTTNNSTGIVLPGTTTTGTTTTDPTTGTTTTTAATTLASIAQLATQSLTGFGGVSGALAIGKSFGLAVRALEGTGRFKTISRPLIFTSNNKAATILSGQEIAVPTGTVSGITGVGTTTGALTSNIQYRRVALQLDVVPLINSSNAVTLDIVQQVNNVIPNSGTNVGGVSGVPAISTRAVKSTVTVPNLGTIVLGGLITQSENINRANVPLLNRIPLVGELFKSRTKDNTRNELIVLLRPTITNTAAQLVQNRVDEENHLYLEPGLDEQLRPILKAKPVEATTTTTVRRQTQTTTVYGK